MENHTNQKDPKKELNESQETLQITESVDPCRETHTSREEAKAISELEGLKKRIDECPSSRVREALKDSLNKENCTPETNE